MRSILGCGSMCIGDILRPLPSSARGEMRQLSIDLAAARHSGTGAVPVRPYAIVASIFNLEDRLEDFMERLHRIVITSGSSATVPPTTPRNA